MNISKSLNLIKKFNNKQRYFNMGVEYNTKILYKLDNNIVKTNNIGELYNKKINIYNGNEFINTTIKLSNIEKFLKITFLNKINLSTIDIKISENYNLNILNKKKVKLHEILKYDTLENQPEWIINNIERCKNIYTNSYYIENTSCNLYYNGIIFNSCPFKDIYNYKEPPNIYNNLNIYNKYNN